VTDVDDAPLRIRHGPWGPLATGDLAGRRRSGLGRIRKGKPPPAKSRELAPRHLLKIVLCEIGGVSDKKASARGGTNTMRNRKSSADPTVASLIREWTSEARIPASAKFRLKKIVGSLRLHAGSMEGARILEEGPSLCVRSTSISSISTATAFPAYRGGPMWYRPTRSVLKKSFTNASCEFSGNDWAIGGSLRPLLQRLAEQGKNVSPNSAAVEAWLPEFAS